MLLYVQFIGEEQSDATSDKSGDFGCLEESWIHSPQLLPRAAESGMDTLGWPSLALPCAFPAAKGL